MKATFFAMAIAMIISLPAVGQTSSDQPSDKEQKANRKTEALADKLQLSEDQREEVYEATLEMLQEKKDEDKSKGEAKKEYDDRMRDILNDEQYTTWRKQRKKGDLKHKTGAKRKDHKKKDGAKKEHERSY